MRWKNTKEYQMKSVHVHFDGMTTEGESGDGWRYGDVGKKNACMMCDDDKLSSS